MQPLVDCWHLQQFLSSRSRSRSRSRCVKCPEEKLTVGWGAGAGAGLGGHRYLSGLHYGKLDWTKRGFISSVRVNYYLQETPLSRTPTCTAVLVLLVNCNVACCVVWKYCCHSVLVLAVCWRMEEVTESHSHRHTTVWGVTPVCRVSLHSPVHYQPYRCKLTNFRQQHRYFLSDSIYILEKKMYVIDDISKSC